MKREEQFHRSVVQLLDMLGWLYWHTPNGELRNKRIARKLKAMGVRPGVSDFIICEPWEYFEKGKHLFGDVIAMEIKIDPNVLTKAQQQFLADVGARGWLTSVCYNMNQVINVLRNVRPLNGRRLQDITGELLT